MDEVSSNQHSSAYSSLANSTTEIHDIVKMEGESSGKVRNNKRATVDLQMRAITEDYNALLRRATEQIRDGIQCVLLEVSSPKVQPCAEGLWQRFIMFISYNIT